MFFQDRPHHNDAGGNYDDDDIPCCTVDGSSAVQVPKIPNPLSVTDYEALQTLLDSSGHYGSSSSNGYTPTVRNYEIDFYLNVLSFVKSKIC